MITLESKQYRAMQCNAIQCKGDHLLLKTAPSSVSALSKKIDKGKDMNKDKDMNNDKNKNNWTFSYHIKNNNTPTLLSLTFNTCYNMIQHVKLKRYTDSDQVCTD